MKSSTLRDPTRWRDRDADTHALESRAALLAAAASQVPPLGPAALSRIRTKVEAQRPGRGLFGFGQLSVRARLAFAVVLVIVCITTAGGASVFWRKYVSSPVRVTPPPAEKTPPPARHRVSRPTALAVAEPVEPPVEDDRGDDEKAKLALPPLLPRVRPTAPPSAPEPIAIPALEPPAQLPSLPDLPPAPPPAKVTEANLVAEALSDLRQRKDPRAALSTLDRHAREFPHGVLETEALRTRVEAVIALGDMKTALALLEGKRALPPDVLGADLLLTRAELRAAAGRFREALPDFDQLVDSAAGPLVAGGDERALYGRAVCLGRLARDDRARADLLAYQKRFPNGRFAVEVGRLLGGSVPLQRP